MSHQVTQVPGNIKQGLIKSHSVYMPGNLNIIEYNYRYFKTHIIFINSTDWYTI